MHRNTVLQTLCRSQLRMRTVTSHTNLGKACKMWAFVCAYTYVKSIQPQNLQDNGLTELFHDVSYFLHHGFKSSIQNTLYRKETDSSV